jgi:hypothetical protein
LVRKQNHLGVAVTKLVSGSASRNVAARTG